MASPIVYFEIAGPDSSSLMAFYASVFAWQIDPSGAVAAMSDGGIRGGVRQDPAELLFYVAVPNIDETLKRIEASGGQSILPRTVVPGVVTFALFTDPAGNRMGLTELGREETARNDSAISLGS